MGTFCSPKMEHSLPLTEAFANDLYRGFRVCIHFVYIILVTS